MRWACPHGHANIAHCGASGGHYPGHVTAQRILQSGLWWPFLFRDATQFVKMCNTCQRCGSKPTRRSNRPLSISLAWQPFERWGIDFVGPIHPTSQPGGLQYLLVATDYATKWAEVKATRDCTAHTVAIFLYENIFTRFGCPIEIISDQGKHFVNAVLSEIFSKYKIFHRKSCAYYPRANRHAKSTNKVLIQLLKKACFLHPTTWGQAILGVTWAYRTVFKATTTHTPFRLAFGIEAIAPFEFLGCSPRVHSLRAESYANIMASNLSHLILLEESRASASASLSAEQHRRKA